VDDLARIWLGANSEQKVEITVASERMDRQLRRDPMGVGQARDRGWRVLVAPPLAVKYEVSDDDRLVRVVDVWQFTVPTP
jgi:G:T-mismatch repair DNA endonuclease (very short patch repair protein)